MSETIRTILTADNSNFRAEFERAQKTITNFEGKTESLRKSVLAVGGAVAGGFGLQALTGIFNDVRNSIDKINDQAAQLSLGVEEVQRLNAVATMSGASVEALSKALTRAKLSAVDAAQGNAELSENFRSLNIDAAKFINLNATEQLVALSQGFNQAGAKGDAFASVFAVMGKGAAQLIPLLKDGQEGIENISRTLQVLGGEDVAAVARMNDSLDLLSKNLQTQLGKSFVSLTPQIESFVKGLSEAAQGLAVFLDPSRGVGSQGGELGGAAMLRDIDKLSTRIDEIKAKQADGVAWYEGPLGLQRELNKSVEAVEALKSRYASLSEEAKIFADQINAFERARNSGMGETELRAALDVIQSTTAEKLRTLEAERNLAAESEKVAGNFEKQLDSAGKLASQIEALQGKLDRQDDAARAPEVRSDLARMERDSILVGAGANDEKDLIKKVREEGDPAARLKRLQDLERFRKVKEDIAKADAEIEKGLTTQGEQYETLQKAIRNSTAATNEAREAGKALVDQARSDPAQEAARADFGAEMRDLDLRRQGKSEIADALREEINLRKQAREEAQALGIADDNALANIRARNAEQKELAEAISSLPERQQQRQDRRDFERERGKEDARARNRFDEKTNIPRTNEDKERARNRANAPDEKKPDAEKDPAEYWERTINLQEELVGYFKKLGIA